MKKLFVSFFIIVTIVALGEGIFIFTKLKATTEQTKADSAVARISQPTEDSEKTEGKLDSTEAAPKEKAFSDFLSEKYDAASLKHGTNGELLESEETIWGNANHYAFTIQLVFSDYAHFLKEAYSTLTDCATKQNPIKIPNNTEFSSCEYIIGTIKDSTVSCFKAIYQNSYYIYITCDDDSRIFQSIRLFEESRIEKFGGKEYRMFSFDALAWYRNQMEVYKTPGKDSEIAFLYDYEMLGIKNGFDYYPPATEVAVELDSGTYWLKLECPLGTGWIPATEGNVERGGPVFHFPEDDLEFIMSPP